MSDTGFLPKFGAKLIDAGYRIIPIPPGNKLPVEPEWQKTYADKRLLKAWLNPERIHPTTERKTNYDRAGIGILTEDTPFVDVDIMDKGITAELEAFIVELVGMGPVRVGRAPKFGMLFRAPEVFRKLQTSEFIHPETGDAQRVEILAKGQQFVAYAIHPKTGKPYEWMYGDSPLATSVEDLPAITLEQAQAIVAEGERLMLEAGWEIKNRRREGELTTLGKIDLDNPFASDKHKTVITNQELHRKLLMIPNEDADYDTWLNIGMALYHQFDGSEDGLEYWMQWSEQSSKHDTELLEYKWTTLDIEGKGRTPLTARYIIKLADEQAVKIATETYKEVCAMFKNAISAEGFLAACDKVKHTEFSDYQRKTLVSMAQKSYKAINDATLTIADARAMLRYENPTIENLPSWLEGWVFIELDESFYSMTKKKTLSTTAFNAVHSRFLLTRLDVLEGRSQPEQVPSQVALNQFQIPVVRNRMYMPGEDDLFWMNGVQYVNFYDGSMVPDVPEKLRSSDIRAQKRVMGHFAHLFEEEADRICLIDYMAYIVQTNQRVNFAVLLQGVEQDGKTFFAELMKVMLGWSNVKSVQAQSLQEQYTPWAEGAQVVFFEEIRLQGHNRYDILNRVKPFITNSTATIRRMQTDLYEVVNTVNYMFSTNYKDALPLDDNASRYLVLFSRFQTKAALMEFKRAFPDYYDELYATLVDHGPALRQMFLEWEISPSFNPKHRAPDSAARREMIDLHRSDEMDVLEEILLESPRCDMTRDLLNATDLGDEMQARGAPTPYGKTMSKLLLDCGFTKLGRVRVKDRICMFWSQKPRQFKDSLGGYSNVKIIEYLDDAL